MPKLKEIPTKEINKAKKLAGYNVKDATIEGILGWNQGFIRNRKELRKVLHKKRQEFMAELAEKQYETAITDKDKTMQIFLGKNYLGQTDKQDHNINVDFKPVKIDLAGKKGK